MQTTMPFFCALALSCGSDPPDSSSEADADTDVDADTDADPPWSGLQGTVELYTELLGEPRCDASIEVSGVAYTGDCSGCDFAFAMTGSVVRDDSVTDCFTEPLVWFEPTLSFVPSERLLGLYLAYGEAMTYAYEVFQSAIFSGYTLRYGDGTYGPYWYPFAHGDSKSAQVTFSGDALGVAYSSGELVLGFNYTDLSCDEWLTQTDGAPAEGVTVTGQLPCDADAVDVWEIATKPDQEVRVSVDTVAAGTTFDPALLVTDAEDCPVLEADESFECAQPPEDFACPAASFTAQHASYRVFVRAWDADSCAGEVAAYTLSVDAADPAPKLVVDDGATFVRYEISSTLDATLVP